MSHKFRKCPINPIFSTVSCDDVCRTLLHDLETAIHALCIGLKCILSTAQQATDMERQKREREVADKEQHHLVQRKADVTQKQKEAEQLIAEASSTR